MRVLITGICGFIGSHLAERMAVDGWEVSGIDHATDKRLPAMQNGKPFELCCGNVSTEALRGFEQQPDVIVHLAARLGPAEVMADPLAVLREHHEDAVAVLEYASECGAAVVLASSSEVYQAADGEMREDDWLRLAPPSFPRASYALAKLSVEALGHAYARKHGLYVVMPRFFNVVGARQREGFVLPNFAKAAMSGDVIRVHGDGQQMRSFTHVTDAVDAIMRLVNRPRPWRPEAVNIAAGSTPRPIGAVAEDIAMHVMRFYDAPPVQVEYVPWGDDALWRHMRERNPDVTRLKALTGAVFTDRWDDIVRDVCADWAERLGVRRKAEEVVKCRA